MSDRKYKGTMTEAQREYIISEYLKGEKTYKEIGSRLGINYNTIRTYIRFLVQKGELVALNRRAMRKEKGLEKISEEKESKNKVQHTTDYNVDVDCNKMHKKCRYGASGDSKCNFRSCVGRARILTSPDPKHCHDFVKIDKDHPKIIVGGPF